MIDVRPIPPGAMTEEEAKARTEKIREAIKRADEERGRAYMRVIRGIKEAAAQSRKKRALGITELSQPSPASSKTFSPPPAKSPTPPAEPDSAPPSSQVSQSSQVTGGGTRRSISAELRKWSKLFLRVRWAQIKREERERKEMEAAAEAELEEIRKELAEAQKKKVKRVVPKGVTPADEKAINEFLDAWKDGV